MFRVFLRLQQIPGGTRIRNKRLYEIQVANQLWKAALKTSLRLFSDIFCKSGHSLCRIRQRTCPEDRVIVLCHPLLVTSFLRNQNRFLNEQLRSPSSKLPNCTHKNFPTSYTISSLSSSPKSRDFETYFAADFFMNLKKICASIKGKLISSCSD